MKNALSLLFSIAISVVSYSQENYEIQVYGSQTQQRNSTILELHSNFTFNGEHSIVKDVRPTYHSLHETLEITHGIGDIFELGAYLFTNYTPHYGYQVVGTHIRPRIMAPAKWKLPVGLSLSAEVGYQKPQYSDETWNIEVRPIIDRQFNKLYVSFNPTFGISLKGMENSHVPVFEPNIKVTYATSNNVGLGVEYYGSVGPVNAFEKLTNESHSLFATFDMLNNKNWEFNAGAGFGLTPVTDGFIFKVIIGRRIFWKKKNG